MLRSHAQFLHELLDMRNLAFRDLSIGLGQLAHRDKHRLERKTPPHSPLPHGPPPPAPPTHPRQARPPPAAGSARPPPPAPPPPPTKKKHPPTRPPGAGAGRCFFQRDG